MGESGIKWVCVLLFGEVNQRFSSESNLFGDAEALLLRAFQMSRHLSPDCLGVIGHMAGA